MASSLRRRPSAFSLIHRSPSRERRPRRAYLGRDAKVEDRLTRMAELIQSARSMDAKSGRTVRQRVDSSSGVADSVTMVNPLALAKAYPPAVRKATSTFRLKSDLAALSATAQ